MKPHNRCNIYKQLLEQSLEINSKILKECYWRPTVTPETLQELNSLVAAIEEQLKTGSV